jgi:thioredoxin reductase (NADPH)
MFDAAIIGTGPAGLSAAVNLRQREKSFVWFGSATLSNKVQRSELLANVPGIPYVTGAELNERFLEQVHQMGLEITDKVVTSVAHMDKGFVLLADNQTYEARTVLLACGMNAGRQLAGEADLLGHGVSYCATCDGFLHKGKTIVAVCAAPRFEHDVEYLAGLADKVYLQATYDGCGVDLPNVEKLASPVHEILGERRVSGVRLADGTELAASGVFLMRNAILPTTLLPGLATDGQHIAVDRSMATNVPGCFAAGDCTGRPYQIAKAMGEGNIAAHGMVEYLAELDKAAKRTAAEAGKAPRAKHAHRAPEKLPAGEQVVAATFRTSFPYGRIDFGSYIDEYMDRDDAIRRIPGEAELREEARKAIVKGHITLEELPQGTKAELGDTLDLRCVSELPRYNKPKVTASLGRGLYNKDLELALVGHAVGETVHVAVGEKDVEATVLRIRRKQVPEPTDEMVAELAAKDNQNQPITTVAAYEDFMVDMGVSTAEANVLYYVMEQILEDCAIDEYDEGDVAQLGRLERVAFRQIFLEQEGVDLETQPAEWFQETWHCDSYDGFIAMRHDWYQMKIQQCYIYANILGERLEGDLDPLEHYETLSKLSDMMYKRIKDELDGRNA